MIPHLQPTCRSHPGPPMGSLGPQPQAWVGEGDKAGICLKRPTVNTTTAAFPIPRLKTIQQLRATCLPRSASGQSSEGLSPPPPTDATPARLCTRRPPLCRLFCISPRMAHPQLSITLPGCDQERWTALPHFTRRPSATGSRHPHDAKPSLLQTV